LLSVPPRVASLPAEAIPCARAALGGSAPSRRLDKASAVRQMTPTKPMRQDQSLAPRLENLGMPTGGVRTLQLIGALGSSSFTDGGHASHQATAASPKRCSISEACSRMRARRLSK